MPPNANWPIEGWHAQFGVNPNSTLSAISAWQSLNGRVLGFRAGYGGQYELNSIEAGECELALLNDDEALNPANTSSPFNSGSNRLRPYRRVMGTATWPTTPGNLLNAANAAQWGQSTDTSTFEGGGVGEWVTSGSTPPTRASSTVRAQAGTRSMLITWPTAANGGTNTVSLVWAPSQGPFTIGQQYTLTAYLWAASGVPRMRVQFGGTVVVGPVNNSTWQRVTVTWTADAVWSAFQIYPDANTSGQQVWVDSVQVDLGATASTFSTTGPIIYPLFAGHIERYPIGWDAAGYLGKATLTCVDSLAVLPRMGLIDCLSEDVSADTPQATVTYGDAGGRLPKPAPWTPSVTVMSWANAGGRTAPALGTAGSPSIDGGTCALYQPDSATDYVMTRISGLSPPIAAPGASLPASVELWFRRPAGPPGAVEVIADAFTPASSQPLQIGLTASGQVFARQVDNASIPSYFYTITSVLSFANDDWHHVVWTQTGAATKTSTLYVDGSQVAQNVSAFAGPSPMPYSVFVGGAYYPLTGPPFTGEIAWLSWYWSALSAQRIADHAASARTGHLRDLPGARLRRVLAWAGWQGPQAITADGANVMGAAAGLSGRSVAEIAAEVGTSENGYVVCHPDGDLTLVTRESFHLQTGPKVTFGEDTAAGEVPYGGGIGYDLDPSFVFNDIEVTGAGDITSGAATDAASEAAYFRSSLQRSTALAREQDTIRYRDHLLNKYKQPALRVAEIEINPAANPSLWPTALGLKFGDRVAVKRRTRAFTMSTDFYVLHRSHETGPGVWKTRFQLVPIEPVQAWILGDATHGVLGSTTRAVF